MESIKNWTFSVCCASIVCGILNMLLPEGNTQKIFKTVLCVFFLCTIISPILNFDFGIIENLSEYIGTEDSNSYENEFNDFSKDYLETEIIAASEEVLKKFGIKAKEIHLDINIFDDSNIDINEFVLVLNGNINKGELSEEIFKVTGLKPIIVISGES